MSQCINKRNFSPKWMNEWLRSYFFLHSFILSRGCLKKNATKKYTWLISPIVIIISTIAAFFHSLLECESSSSLSPVTHFFFTNRMMHVTLSLVYIYFSIAWNWRVMWVSNRIREMCSRSSKRTHIPAFLFFRCDDVRKIKINLQLSKSFIFMHVATLCLVKGSFIIVFL